MSEVNLNQQVSAAEAYEGLHVPSLMQEWASRVLDAARSRCYLIPSDANALPGLLTSRSAQEGAAVTAYFCSGHHCSAPATSLEEFSESLGN